MASLKDNFRKEDRNFYFVCFGQLPFSKLNQQAVLYCSREGKEMFSWTQFLLSETSKKSPPLSQFWTLRRRQWGLCLVVSKPSSFPWVEWCQGFAYSGLRVILKAFTTHLALWVLDRCRISDFQMVAPVIGCASPSPYGTEVNHILYIW